MLIDAGDPKATTSTRSTQQLPLLEHDEIEPRFRAVTGPDGERRGIRLERIYWDGLNQMSAAGKMTTADIVHHTASQFPEGNLASLLRVLSLKWTLGRLSAAEELTSLDNLKALINASPSPTIVLTKDRRIQLFNDPFLTMLRQRLRLTDVRMLANGLRFSIDNQMNEVLETLQTNRGKTMNIGFSMACGDHAMKGRINIALAPAFEKSMLVGFIASF
ncbi:MAG: ribbon-helix-helix domain-containing protein [Pseudorhizobium sp.]